MKLIGNSVSVPVIDVLIKSIISTGVFEVKTEQKEITRNANNGYSTLSPFGTPTAP